MDSSKIKVAALMGIGVMVFILLVIFTGFSAQPNVKSLFPNSTEEVTEKFKLEILPTHGTYTIWIAAFVYQMLWMAYLLTSLFGNNDASDILSKKFYLFFLLNQIFMIAKLFAWSRQEIVRSFLMTTMAQIFLDVAFYFASTDLNDYLSSYQSSNLPKYHIWCQRLLVQNGVLFYASWTTFIVLIDTTTVLAYVLKAPAETACILALSILTFLIFLWYILENFAFRKYTEYTFTSYIACIWVLSGILANVWGENDNITGFVLFLTLFSIVLFFIRIVLVVVRNPPRRRDYDEIEYLRGEDINF